MYRHDCERSGARKRAGEGRRRGVGCVLLREPSPDVDDDGERLSNLREIQRPDVASGHDDPLRRNGSKVLALCCRGAAQSIGLVGFDHDLGMERADRAGERNHVNDGRPRVEDPLRRDHDRRMEKSCFAALGSTEIEIDHVTRGALTRTRTCTARSLPCRSGSARTRASRWPRMCSPFFIRLRSPGRLAASAGIRSDAASVRDWELSGGSPECMAHCRDAGTDRCSHPRHCCLGHGMLRLGRRGGTRYGTERIDSCGLSERGSILRRIRVASR